MANDPKSAASAPVLATASGKARFGGYGMEKLPISSVVRRVAKRPRPAEPGKAKYFDLG